MQPVVCRRARGVPVICESGCRTVAMLLTLIFVGGCSTRTEPRTPFANRLEEYLEMRRTVLAAHPRLQLSSAEELDDRQNNLAQRLRLLRTGIGQGYLFTA